MESESVAKLTGKTFYERSTEAIRLVGTGNAAGLVASAAALATAIDKHWSNAILLKWSAVCFTLGVISFSYAYYSHYQSYRYLDTIFREAEQVARTGEPIPERKRGSTGTEFAARSAIATVVSVVAFYLGMLIALGTLLSL